MSQGLLNFVVVGAKNSGKTVYLSTLFGLEPSLATASKETTEYLKANWDELKAGELPSATSSRVVTLDFEYKTDIHSVGFRIDDYDGYFAETLGSDDENTQEDREKLKKNIKEAQGLLFFFPFEKTIDEESMERFRYEINTFIQLIKDIYPNQKDLPIPIFVAVSKWDRSPHFNSHDQNKKAIEYLKSVPAYRAAIEMIYSFFSDVEIQPISSLGKTADGIHPVEGKIEPYNIAGPFKYFLDITFDKFENKAEELQASNDLPELYRFLTTIYDDALFYRDGKINQLHADTEMKYASDVIEKLKSAASPSEQNDIINEHYFLYSNLKNEDFAKEIESLIYTEKSKKNKRNIIIGSTITILLLAILYGVMAYKEYEKEQIAFAAIQTNSADNMPKELAERCSQYLNKYQGKSIMLPFIDVAGHRQYVEASLSSVKSVFVQDLKDTYERIKSEKLSEDNLAELKELQSKAGLFPDLEISQRIEEYHDQFIDRLERKQEFTSILNEAQSLLASDPDLSEVENILVQFNDLPNDVEILNIKSKLEERLQMLQLKDKFNQIYNEVNDARTVFEFPEIVGRKWETDFSEENAQTLMVLIQDKIAKMDSEAINDLQVRFESVMDVDEQTRALEEIEKYSMEIPQLSFHYERRQYLKEKFKEAKNQTNQYKKILQNGIWLSYIKFGASSKENKPLGFGCGLFKGHEIVMNFGGKIYSYKKKIDCNDNSDGSQIMVWNSGDYLKTRVYSITVTEVDAINDESIAGTISISKKDLLRFYNDGHIKFPFPETYSPYFLIFN